MNENRLWTLGASFAIVVILLLGWMIGVSPKLGEAQLAAAEKATVDSQNTAQEAVNVVLREQFANLDALKLELEDFQRTIPEDPLVEDFIDFVKATADATEAVTVESITLAEADATDLAAASQAAPTATKPPPAEGAPAAPAPASTGSLYGLGLTIEVQGPPESVMDFTRGLQYGERIFFVSRVDFSSGTGAVRGGTVVGYVFVLRDAQSAKAPVE